METVSDFDIAIIGLAGRFPGAADLEQFWRNLAQGVESITFFGDEVLRAAGVAPELLSQPTYVKANAVIDAADSFDAHFFNISPREASLMDPQQRLFLECAWSALEHAGYDTAQVAARIGVFAGAQLSTYLLHALYPHLATLSEAEQFQALIGNDKDYLATQTAYRLNLRGPALSVQTACSTSLVAVHLACQSLLNRECDLALAGGVALRLPQVAGYRYEAGGILSPDGHCRPFAAQANGTVSGNGVGVVALKRLGDALADGDAICAVIKGSAINNDGASRLGFTAPSEDGQATVISEALAMAGVEAADIGYVEAHGTGTPLGDPIEIAALTRAFAGCPPHSCAIGSVKGNIGHLDAAAGVAGLIKAVLSLQHQILPPSLHAGDPNPKIPWADSPFYVNTRLHPWPITGQPRRAGVSSFGIGGTNVHVVLEAPPSRLPTPPTSASQILPLSAQTPEALAAMAQRLADHLERPDAPALADVAYTCQRGRRAWPYRRVVVGHDTAEVAAALRAPDGLAGYCEPGFRPIAFLFPGQGAQYVSMGRQLFNETPLLRDILERCAQQLKPWLGLDLRDILYPPMGSVADQHLNSTALAQPALFVIEYALAELWRAWGLAPHTMLGHSLGEYVAACLAGVFSLEEALWLVTQRGRLMQSLPPGAMLAVQLSEAEAARFIRTPLALAASNAPEALSIAGPTAAIEELAARLSAEGIGWRRLATSHAFHSPMMEPIMEAFAQVVQGVTLHPPAIPFIANVTGDWITPTQATDPWYWAEQLRRPVQFARGVATLAAEPGLIGLEVGPGHTLRSLIRQHQPALTVATSLPPARAETLSDALFLKQSLGQLWLAGATPDWEQIHAPDRPRRVPLPTYPFQRRRYWPAFSASPAETATNRAHTGEMQLGEMDRRAESDWFYLPYWKPTAWPAATAASGSAWLVGAASPLAAAWEQHTPGVVWLDSAELSLPASAPPPTHLIYLADEQFNAPQLARLLQHLQRAQCLPAQLTLVTRGAQAVSPQETLTPHQALVTGMGLVIPQEYPGLVCRQIDLPSTWPDREHPRLAAQLAAELGHTDQGLMVAWRHGQRWTLQFEPATPPPLGTALRPGGVYLIIGGWGQVGRALARSLAEESQAKIALLGRRHPTEQERAWQRSLESAGAETLALTADAADEAALRQALAQVEARFGALHGVFHAAGADAAHLFAPLSEMGAETWEAHFRPKVAGVDALARALAERSLDFCLLFSSLAAQLGGLGFAAYAAANRYLDVMAHQCRQTQATPWVSVNWDALKFDADETEQAFGARLRQTALTPTELTRACGYVLRLGPPPQVVVSTTDLAARRRQWLGDSAAYPSQAVLRQAQEPARATQPTAARHPRPPLATPYAPPQTALERSLAAMWGEVLNIEPIGRHDNLFDLGGHSLFATQIAARVRAQLEVELPLADLFTSVTTVAEMAQAIEQRQLAQAEAGALAAALDNLAQLSDAEIELLLAQAADDGVED